MGFTRRHFNGLFLAAGLALTGWLAASQVYEVYAQWELSRRFADVRADGIKGMEKGADAEILRFPVRTTSGLTCSETSPPAKTDRAAIRNHIALFLGGASENKRLKSHPSPANHCPLTER